MIKLTNQLDMHVYINPKNITYMEVCSLNEKDSRTLINYHCVDVLLGCGSIYKRYTDGTLEDLPAVKIHFVCGSNLIVQECLSEIEKKILDYE